ncbi:ABC transporter ATP-binding protein [Halorutilales archaeon Cl-col2-1]
MSDSDEHGGFESIREEVKGNPIVRLLGYTRPYKLRLITGVLMSFCTRLARLAPPVIIATAIDRIIFQRGEPGLLARIGLVPSDTVTNLNARAELLETLVIIAVVAYLVRSVTRFLSRYLIQSAAQKIQRDLRNDTYDHLQHLSMSFFTNHQTGGMMSILNSDINRLEQFLNTEFRQFLRVIAMVGGISLILWYYSPTLALIALAPVPVVGVASGGFLRWIEPRYQSIRETVARLNTRLENNLGGVAVVKAFNRYDFERARVENQSQRYHDEKVGALRIRRAFFAGLRLLTGVVFVVVLYVAGKDFIATPTGKEPIISAGAFAAFFMLLRRLYSPMRRVGKSANKYQLAKSSAERVFGLLATQPSMTSPSDPYQPQEIDGDVVFDSVSFGYNDSKNEKVIEDLSLEVPAGTTIGLVGESGAGKSTLLKLIPRLYDVDSGSVKVDGTDVREYGVEALRDKIAVVEQNPYLFSGTVAENIAYGNREILRAESSQTATDKEDEDEVRKRITDAAQAAEAHGFIRDLPDGYDTQIGERGVKLSGGQRQRVAIARALLNDPDIIIFDEATSDVDTETEDLIQQSLERLIHDRTAFIIAHRLATTKNADRIIVLEDGEIVESGTHKELVQTEGVYASLWNAQANMNEPIGSIG